MMELLTDPNAWAALLTLSALEIVLGIDNIIFISILIARADAKRAKLARQVGLSLAFVFRIALLGALSWIMGLTAPVLTILGNELSWRDIILIGGGLFLIAKATHEIHGEVEAEEDGPAPVTTEVAAGRAFFWIILQLVAIDLVFSLDSILTAIGLVDRIEIMVAAIVFAMIVMYVASGPVAAFIAEHPTTKMLALAFLVMIGVALMADGFGFHIPRGYIYISMAFAAAVETFNVLAKRNRVKRRANETK
ncbi:MAG: TerC family protein [Rhizobiales bacterium]|nr:TerC family protein [Hyphomicrobiales bacterium]